MSGPSDRGEPVYHVLGVPLRTGSLYPGSENDAQPYREVGLIGRLQAAGCQAIDESDLAIPSYLPHHSIPPIRSWPGPRIVWDLIGERIDPWLRQPGHVPLLIGCDCSIVVGTAQALRRAHAAANDVYVIYLDGDFDDATPSAERCQSAAAQAVWLLTQESPFCAGPPLPPANVTVIGWTIPSQMPEARRARALSLAELRRAGAAAAARQALDAIPASAAIVLHFDTDVFERRALPSVYFPHDEGLTLSEGAEVLDVILKDPRLRIVEVSEYSSLRDPQQRDAGQLVELLVNGLRQ